MIKVGGKGMYQLACDKSVHKLKIDQWLNEGKSIAWIKRQLESLGEKIGETSIAKYKRLRDEKIQQEMLNDPDYQNKMQQAGQTLVDEVSKIKHINVVNHIADTIEHCAELLHQAKIDEIKIQKAQDIRFIQQSMLEAIRTYGEIALQAQQYDKVNENPDLLRPTVNVNAKNLIVDMMQGMGDDIKSKLIDNLRNGVKQAQEVDYIESGDNNEYGSKSTTPIGESIRQYDKGSIHGNTMSDRSSKLDRTQKDSKGEAILIQR